MEQVMASIPDFEIAETGISKDNSAEAEQFKFRVDEIFQKVDEVSDKLGLYVISFLLSLFNGLPLKDGLLKIIV